VNGCSANFPLGPSRPTLPLPTTKRASLFLCLGVTGDFPDTVDVPTWVTLGVAFAFFVGDESVSSVVADLFKGKG